MFVVLVHFHAGATEEIKLKLHNEYVPSRNVPQVQALNMITVAAPQSAALNEDSLPFSCSAQKSGSPLVFDFRKGRRQRTYERRINWNFHLVLTALRWPCCL